MKLRHIFDGFFSKFSSTLFFILVFTAAGLNAQSGKVELRSIDNSDNKISSGVQFYGVSEESFAALFQKFSDSKLFTVAKEYMSEKSYGFISIKSVGSATLKDFEMLLVKAGIEKVNYSGELINVNDLSVKYKSINKIEVRPRPNR